MKRLKSPLKMLIKNFGWSETDVAKIIPVETTIVNCYHADRQRDIHLVSFCYDGRHMGYAGKCRKCGKVYYKPSELAKALMEEATAVVEAPEESGCDTCDMNRIDHCAYGYKNFYGSSCRRWINKTKGGITNDN